MIQPKGKEKEKEEGGKKEGKEKERKEGGTEKERKVKVRIKKRNSLFCIVTFYRLVCRINSKRSKNDKGAKLEKDQPRIFPFSQGNHSGGNFRDSLH